MLLLDVEGGTTYNEPVLKRSDFSYHLPDDLIAQEPRQRGRSRMMVVHPGREPLCEHRSFADFPSLLDGRDVLVINDTEVIPARLFAEPKGAMKNRIEILLTRERQPMVWEAWCKPARRVRAGDRLRFSDSLSGHITEKTSDGVVIRFEGDPAEMDRLGVPPLPPYIARAEPRESDRSAYQTVYAAARGAVAAPTAGLHFTTEILDAIAARGTDVVRVTLHVGIGTFKPVKVDEVSEHRMDAERYTISDDAAARLNAAREAGKRIVAVGTTTVRTLESAVRAGAGRITAGSSETSIFITPGFEFEVVHRLLTNFHLPESTLLMLVSAFAGMETMRAAYREAIEQRYLFYSYGDCMFISSRGE